MPQFTVALGYLNAGPQQTEDIYFYKWDFYFYKWDCSPMSSKYIYIFLNDTLTKGPLCHSKQRDDYSCSRIRVTEAVRGDTAPLYSIKGVSILPLPQ